MRSIKCHGLHLPFLGLRSVASGFIDAGVVKPELADRPARERAHVIQHGSPRLLLFHVAFEQGLDVVEDDQIEGAMLEDEGVEPSLSSWGVERRHVWEGLFRQNHQRPVTGANSPQRIDETPLHLASAHLAVDVEHAAGTLRSPVQEASAKDNSERDREAEHRLA
jgi:hypothetical protein